MGNAEVPLIHHLLPAVSRQTSHKGDTTFHCHLCQIHPRDRFREQELEIGGSHIMDKADSFHGQIRWEKLDTFAPDSQDVRELWALRPHPYL